MYNHSSPDVKVEMDLLSNIHSGLQPPCQGDAFLVTQNYNYYHYLVDGFDDRGWGCGYRTLQTICSWINMSTEIGKQKGRNVPSLRDIQETLVEMQDKEPSFLGSKAWIGSFEICLVLDNLYDVQSKIVHLQPGSLNSEETIFLKRHFEEFRSPVMMGGDADSASKCILGIFYGHELTDDNVYLLVLDPHFCGKSTTIQQLQGENWVAWKKLSDFDQNSFYNFCLPQIRGYECS